ncbi:MAG TPA: EAL domain-containing protein [Burkholderiaceae bacterium]|jgi:diguanylate cyclase (GGDEF)-like protein|nr:EAL domain-containing protein [Burkholderiaceae bacterium]
MDGSSMPEVLPDRDSGDDLPLILIADDDKATRVLLRRVMEREGYRVVAAETGAEAVRLCQSVAADLILLDFIMPELDGVDACAQIRTLERYKATPVLMITSLDDDASIQRALVCGASDYITKPILLPVLRQRVRHLLASRRAERFMMHLAYHDSLTALPNREYFHQRLSEVLADRASGAAQHAVMYIDLDQFKIVNDTCGHSAGDQLLRQLAHLLQTTLRKGDVLARLGGDEFGVLLIGCDPEQACQVAEKLRATVATFRFFWDSRVFTVGASIGVVPIDGDAVPLATVLSAADAACYAAKDSGRNQVQVYRPENEELRRRRTEMGWVNRITRALDDRRFRLRYQPIVALSAHPGPIEHLEMLVSMVDEKGASIAPDAFIPAAERYNLMPSVDRWVIDSVLRFLGGLPEGAHHLRTCCINLSGASLTDEHLLHYILGKLAEYGVSPRLVCFEITETATIANMNRALRLISELRARGCRFALDDFGTGLASFAYLKHLPVDFLKIDGTFVKDIVRDPVSLAIVKATNEIGHALGIKTIAEYVEDVETLEALRQLGVDYGQGFGIARPKPLESFEILGHLAVA